MSAIKYVAIARKGKAGKILHVQIFSSSRAAYDWTYSTPLKKAYDNVTFSVELAHEVTQ